MVTMGKGDTAMKSGPTVSVLGNTVVFDEDLKPVEPGSGVIGKIARFGDIPVGYYNDPVKTAEVFITIDGTRYVMPGDFATVEADGSITLLGRGSVSINSGGEKIFPEEVESAVRSHPDVFDAIVVGAPDERWGQRVAAIIQPRASTNTRRWRTSRRTAATPLPGTRCHASSMWSTPSCARRAASRTTAGPRRSWPRYPRRPTAGPADGSRHRACTERHRPALNTAPRTESCPSS